MADEVGVPKEEPDSPAAVLPFWLDDEQSQLPLDKGWLLQLMRAARSELARLKIFYYLAAAGATIDGVTYSIAEISQEIKAVRFQLETLATIAKEVLRTGEPVAMPSKLDIAAGMVVPTQGNGRQVPRRTPAPR